MKNQKGFTLIELLVVIAIIGLLSTMAVVSLNSARGKARDAKRVSDVKQISNLIEMAAANTASGGYNVFATDTCESAGDLTTACGTFEGVDMSTIYDLAGGTTVCANAAPTTECAYTMGITATASNYEVCFVLEEGAGSVPSGINRITAGGVISTGCSI